MKRLVLFSGGLKSTFLAALAQREGEAVLCHFILTKCDSERYSKLVTLADLFGLKLFVYDLLQTPPLKETLLRMLYLVLNALPIAKEQQCKCIYYGLSRDDDQQIVQVLDPYVKQLNALVQLAQPLYDGRGFYLGQVEVETPLRRLDRRRVIRLGNEWSLPWESTFSCTRNTVIHCGECKSCRQRKAAFRQEGYMDSTTYRKETQIGKEL